MSSGPAALAFAKHVTIVITYLMEFGSDPGPDAAAATNIQIMNDTNSAANPKQNVQIADFGERVLVNQNKLASELNPHYDLMRREKNNLKQIKALAEWNKVVPFAPCAASDRMGWEGLQAVYYRESPASEVSFPPVSQHVLVLMIRPPEKFDLRYEGVKRDMRPPAGSIAVVPAYSSVLCRWQGRKDSLLIYLEPSLVERVAAESFELDPTRTVVPPLDGLNVPELRFAMLAVDAELRSGGVGGPLMVEALATVLTVHLIRHITNPHRRPVSADGVLPRRKLRTVTKYIMENLEGSPTLEQMAALAHLSPYHFARQFKATTGLPPHQYVIERRVERAQDLLRRDAKLGLAEVAFRVGFLDQSHFSFHFKRIVGVTPRQFRISAGIGEHCRS